MIFKKLKQIFLLATFVIPVNDPKAWSIEKFSNIKSNQVEFSKQGMLIKVSKSASPIIYSFGTNHEIKGFKIKGNFYGLPIFKDVTKQGEKKFDDYALRVGLVVAGKNKLTGIKKMFAPEWVKKFNTLAPENTGLDHVHFYNFTQNAYQLGLSRNHPSSDLIQEEFIAVIKSPGAFESDYSLKNSLNAFAIWLSVDGDDTQSEFDVLVSSIELY